MTPTNDKDKASIKLNSSKYITAAKPTIKIITAVTNAFYPYCIKSLHM